MEARRHVPEWLWIAGLLAVLIDDHIPAVDGMLDSWARSDPAVVRILLTSLISNTSGNPRREARAGELHLRKPLRADTVLEALIPGGTRRMQPRTPLPQRIITPLPARGAVLLVDDNYVSLRATEIYLQNLGCVVITAVDGVQALQRAHERTFDLIILDQQFFPVDEALLKSGAVKLPIFLATGHFYLNDMTLELCPTWIVPCSHKSGRGPGAKPGEARYGFVGGQEDEWNGVKAVPVLLKAGDFMLFRSEVWHTGSKNTTTDQTRYLLQVHYGRRVMAQRFSPYLDFLFNHEVLAAATPRQKRMLGGHTQGAYD